MNTKEELLRLAKEKGREILDQALHLHKEDVDRVKKRIVKTALNFINKKRDPDKRNAGLIKKLHRKRWLKPLLEFPFQEEENSTLVVMGAGDFHQILGLGLNTTFFISLEGGGIMSYPGCPLIKSEIPPRYKESFFVNDQLLKILSYNQGINRIFLIGSFPIPLSLTDDSYWTAEHCTVWLAEAEEYLIKIIKHVEIYSFLFHDDKLYQVMTEKVLDEKNEGKIGL